MLYELIGYGWCCTDCTMLLANGETPPGMSEDETDEYVSRVDDQGTTEDGRTIYVNLGGEHEDDCPNMQNVACIITDKDREYGWDEDCEDHDHEREWVGDTDCYCEHVEFSWRACDVCGSRFGGSRDAVHFYTTD